MPLQLDQIHKFERVKGTMTVRLLEIQPALRLKSGRDNPPLWIQKGQIYSEGGEEIVAADAPEWFWKELKRTSPQILAECGADRLQMVQPQPQQIIEAPLAISPETQMVEPKRERMWKCDHPGCSAEHMP